ncbi:hypothetical protein BCR36DRAFT_217197, partial [Piromyces finnis]
RCGKNHGKCDEGYCCSEYGWCGESDDHCGIGCQSEFGECEITTTSTPSPIPTTSTPPPTPTSPKKECGKDHGSCDKGYCCSKYGWCGKEETHCGTGCQSEFGEC